MSTVSKRADVVTIWLRFDPHRACGVYAIAIGDAVVARCIQAPNPHRFLNVQEPQFCCGRVAS
jgi:hypothetical protein